MACAKNVPTPISTMPSKTATSLGKRRSGRPKPARAKPAQSVRRAPIRPTAHPASSVVTMDGRNTKYTKPSCIGSSDSGGRTRTKLTKVNVPMKAKRMQKPMPNAARSCGFRRCSAHAANGELKTGRIGVIGVVCATV